MVQVQGIPPTPNVYLPPPHTPRNSVQSMLNYAHRLYQTLPPRTSRVTTVTRIVFVNHTMISLVRGADMPAQKTKSLLCRMTVPLLTSPAPHPRQRMKRVEALPAQGILLLHRPRLESRQGRTAPVKLDARLRPSHIL